MRLTKKDFIRVAIVAIMFVFIIAICFIDTYGDDSGKETWTDEASGLVLEYYPGDEIMIASCASVPSDGVVVLPSEIDGKPVTSISKTGFQGNAEIIELYIPDSVRNLYGETFMQCTNLRKVKLPSGITTLSSDLFRECSSLEEIDIPEGVTTIATRAFYCCNSLKSIAIPASVNTIRTNSGPFFKCPAMEAINVDKNNETYTSVNGVLFSKDMSTLVKYPEGKTDTHYDVPASVTKMETGAFQRAQFTTCTLPDGIKEISADAFENAVNLTEISIPEGVLEIGSNAFYHADSLSKITLPNTLTSIGHSAFYYCHFTSIKIPATVTSIEYSAFMHTFINSIVIPDGIETIPSTLLSESAVQYVYIPDSVVSFDVTAVRWASRLEALFIPASVKTFTNRPGDSVPFNVRRDKFTLYGEAGSAIETYASEHSIKFVAITRDEFEAGVKDGTLPGYVEDENTGGSGGDSGGNGGSDSGNGGSGSESGSGTDSGSDTGDSTGGDNDDSGDGTSGSDSGSGSGTSGNGDNTGSSSGSGGRDGGNTGGSTDSNDNNGIRTAQKITAPDGISKTTNSKAFNIGAKAKTQLSYSSSNKKVASVDNSGKVTIVGPGSAVITVKAKQTSKYQGARKSIRLTVSLAAPTLKAVNKKGSKIKLTWTKSNSADGYLVYVKSPGEKKFKLRLKKKARVKSVTHMGLKSGQTYQYKVRTYKKVGGKIIYSPYSRVSKVKVKK